jgi:hypothetical protein
MFAQFDAGAVAGKNAGSLSGRKARASLSNKYQNVIPAPAGIQ